MIAAHNFRQCLRAALAFAWSLGCYALAYFFFAFVFEFVLGRFAKPWVIYSPAYSAGVLVLITVVGLFRWKSGKTHYGYEDSGMFLDLNPESGRAFMMERAAHRVTGPAYLLGQIFLAAPLQFFKAIGCLRNRLPTDPAFEAQVSDLLTQIDGKRQWEDVRVYEGRLPELDALVRIGLVDHSRTRGRVRAKS